MYVRKRDEMAVSPVIAVILMVAITVVLAGVLFVWVSAFDFGEDPPEPMLLTAEDAATTSGYKAGGDSSAFEPGEPLLRLKQTAGTPVDWQKYTLKMEVYGSDMQYDCAVYSINGKAFSPGNVSKVGDIVLVHCPDATPRFHSGDYVRLGITSGERMIWESGNAPIHII